MDDSFLPSTQFIFLVDCLIFTIHFEGNYLFSVFPFPTFYIPRISSTKIVEIKSVEDVKGSGKFFPFPFFFTISIFHVNPLFPSPIPIFAYPSPPCPFLKMCFLPKNIICALGRLAQPKKVKKNCPVIHNCVRPKVHPHSSYFCKGQFRFCDGPKSITTFSREFIFQSGDKTHLSPSISICVDWAADPKNPVDFPLKLVDFPLLNSFIYSSRIITESIHFPRRSRHIYYTFLPFFDGHK